MAINSDTFYFDLGDQVATFSLIEFTLINGLKLMGDDAIHDDTQRSNRLYDAYFQE